MLSDHDQLIIEGIVNRIFDRRIDPIENKIDQVLKIVTSSNQEHAITKAKVNHLEKRMKKVETKLKIKSPISASVLA